MIEVVASLYKQLSEIYMARQENDRAVLALRDFAVVKLTSSGEPSAEALQIIDKMGRSFEKMENFEEALECYELSLISCCKYYGNTHLSVAKALVGVARMKELLGCTDESVNLMRAANALFILHCGADDADEDDHRQSSNAFRAMPLNLKPVRLAPRFGETSSAVPVATSTDSILIKEKEEEQRSPSEISSKLDYSISDTVSDNEEDISDEEKSRGGTMMPLPARYILNDGEDVATIVSSDNDIVTLASSSSRSFGTLSDIVTVSSPRSVNGKRVVGGRLNLQPVLETSGTQTPIQGWSRASSPCCNSSVDDTVTPKRANHTPSHSNRSAEDTKPGRFTKIFSLADTLRRMQKPRQSAVMGSKNEDSSSLGNVRRESSGIIQSVVGGSGRSSSGTAKTRRRAAVQQELRSGAAPYWI